MRLCGTDPFTETCCNRVMTWHLRANATKGRTMIPQHRLRLKALLKDVFVPDDRYRLAGSAIGKLRMDNQVASIVITMLNSLPDREKFAIRLRYGLDCKSRMTHRELAANMGKSPARAQQIVAKGLRMLRHPRRNDKMAGLLEAIAAIPN
jgi:DNA-directed RNA polymerase specialized sigma24 family protein